jgi:hypothetical protein
MKLSQEPPDGSETSRRLETDSCSPAASGGLVGLIVIVLIVILLGRNEFRLGWPW